MKSELFNTLIEKAVITEATVIDAKYYGNTLGGISTALLEDNFNYVNYKNGYVIVKKINSNTLYKIIPENIIALDGMAPERLAEIYNIKADGTAKKVKIDPLTGLPVRRGRKTNKVKELMNDRLNSLEQRDAATSGRGKTKRSKSPA